MEGIYYVCGGTYWNYDYYNPKFVFKLVRPTDGPPYVARTGEAARSLFRLCQHHSHLYSVDIATGNLRKIESGEIRGESPAVLPADLLDQVRKQVEGVQFTGEW